MFVLLKHKKLKKVTIQTNEFICKDVADTQDDNHGGIMARWNLYHLFNKEKKVGNLVKYFTGTYAVFHELGIRYDLQSSEVKFKEL